MDSFLARIFSPVKVKSRRGKTRRTNRAVLRLDGMEDRVTPANFTVTAIGDNGGVNPAAGAGTGTLRQAIVDANAAAGTDTILFDTTLFATSQIILLEAPLTTITGPLVISGPGTSKANVSGTGQYRVFDLATNSLTVSNITVSGGVAPTTPPPAAPPTYVLGGGGLRTPNNSVVTLDTVAFNGNSTTSAGGAVFVGTGGTLNVTNSTFSGNVATNTGGGINFETGGTLNMSGSTMTNNITTATSDNNGGGAIRLAGVGSLTIVNSTLHNNQSQSSGGAILLGGAQPGGAAPFSGLLNVRHSTITQNAAANTAGGQGGGGIARLNGPGAIEVFSSIVSTNTSTTAPDILMPGGEVLANFSAIGSNTGFGLSGASGNNLGFGAALNLGPLQNNGGVTATRLPATTSPVVNAGPASTGTVTQDQRGATFTRLYLGAADIGAVETQTSTLVSITTTAPNPTNANSITYLITFNQPTIQIVDTNFALVQGNMASAFINTPLVVPSTNNTQWTLVVNNITANAPSGTLGINMVNSTNTNPNPILIPTPPSAPTQPVDGLNPFVGPVRTIDQTAPQITSIVRAGTSPTTGDAVFTVTFNEPVTGVTGANFSITRAGTVAGGVVNVTPSATPTTTWTVTVPVDPAPGGYTGNGTLGLDLTSVTGIRDVATNLLSATGVPLTGQVYAVGSPIVLSVIASTSATNQPTVDYTLTFSQVVTNLTVANLFVQAFGVSGAGIASVTANGGDPSATWTVVVNTGTGEGTVRLQVVTGTGVTNPTTTAPLSVPATVNGTLVSVDRSNPAITSITRQIPLGPGTNAAAVTFLVTFDEPVTGLTLNDFDPVVTGLTGVSEVSVAPVGAAPSATWQVVVNTGSGVGTLGLNLTGTGAIADAATNPLTDPGLPFAGQVYTVDRVQPTVTSIVRQTPPLAGTVSDTNLNSVDFLVTFSEDMAAGSPADFTLVTTGTSTGASVTAVAPGPNPNQRIVTVATGDTEGTIQPQFTGAGTITDLFNNDVSNVGFGQELYNVDTIEPVVASVVRETPRDTNLAQVQFTVNFSETVDALTAGNLVLFTTGTLAGTNIVSVTPVGGAPSADWLVTVGTGTGDGLLRLDVVNSVGLEDGFTNLVMPLPFAGQDYNVDTTLPTIVSISRASPNPTNLSGVNFTVTFDSNVLNVLTSNFTLVTTGAVVGASINSVSGSGTTWTIGVQTGTGSGTVRLDLTAPTGITDTATNGLTDTETGQVFDIDKSNPTITSIVRQVPPTTPTNAASVTFRATFSEAVQNVQLINFNLVAGGGVTGASITSITPVSGSQYDIAVNTGSGDGSLGLNLISASGITDVAGNPLAGLRTGEVYAIDKTPPTVSISRTVTQNDPALGQPVQFTVVFSEPVFGFTGADVAFGGTSAPTTATVTGSGNTYIVGLTGMTTSGTVVASVLAGGATDAAGNPNQGSTGTAPQVNYLHPVVAGIDSYTTAAQKRLTVPASLGVLANDSSNAGPLTANLTQAPPASAGALALSPDGSFVFTPVVGFSGLTTFIYTATDGVSTSVPTTVTINVVPQTVRLAASAGPGGGPIVVVYDVSGALIARFFAYSPEFAGGVQVATGDINNDGVDDVVVGTGVGGAPHVKVFDGTTFKEIASFFAYEDTFRGGVQVAVGDVNGDGRDDVVTGTGVGGGARVRTFNGNGFLPINDFLTFEASFRGGVNVAVGDIDGDKRPEILTSPGFGGGPVVKAFRASDQREIRSFLAFDDGSRAGVSVTVGDVFANGVPDIIVGPGTGSTVRAFAGVGGQITAEIPDAFPVANGGVRVAAKDSNNDDVNDQLLIATGVGDPPRVFRFNLTTMAYVDELFGFPADFKGGIYVG